MKRMVGAFAVAGLLLGSAATRADTLVTKEGQTFNGRVVKEDRYKVVFEIHRFGAAVVKEFRKADVKEITKGESPAPAPKPAPSAKGPEESVDPIAKKPDPPPIVAYDKPTYYVIPLSGEVGSQITADYLGQCLADAAKRKVNVVILEVDTPGGLIAEVDKLVDCLREQGKSLRIVAYVRRALSAGAVTTLACREIYVHPRAVFGAATAYRMSFFGVPMAISEKMQSVWRATARGAADVGGHNPLLAEAMIDNRMELCLKAGPEGKTQLAPGRGSKMLTTKGKLLTMTAKESVTAGLAIGVVEGIGLLREKLGFTEWVECKGHARPLAEYQETALKELRKRMSELGVEFNHCMQKAEECNPTKPKIPYRYYRQTGRYTPESRRRWQSKSRQCATWLMKAEDALTKAAKLIESSKELASYAEFFRDLQNRVKTRRGDVVRDISKRGPDG